MANYINRHFPMRKRLQSVIFTCIVYLPLSMAAQLKPGIDSLKTALQQLYATQRFNGVMVQAKNGQPFAAQMAGNIIPEQTSSFSASTPLQVPGLEQPLAALVMLQLVKQGKISLSTDCMALLPELPYKGITIHHLLTQQSGLPDYTKWYKKHRGPLDTLTLNGIPVLLKALSPPLLFTTGSKIEHSVTNDLLLVLVAEKVTGKSFDALVGEMIFIPWKMKDAIWLTLPAEELNTKYSHAFYWENDRQVKVKPGMDAAMALPVIYASANDLIQFAARCYKAIAEHPNVDKIIAPLPKTHVEGWWQSQPGKGFEYTGSCNGFDVLIHYNAKNGETLVLQNSCSNPLAVTMALDWLNGAKIQVPITSLIFNVKIADGTGTMLRQSAVRLEGSRIMAIGNLKPFEGETVTDGKGNILSPGFIDTHSHLAGYLEDYPQALAALNQGVTTIISGQDGGGDPVDSLKAMIGRQPIAINLATYTGHTTLRRTAMGESSLLRPASDTEISRMQKALETELQKGSLGLSTGLEYEGAFYSHRNEVLALARTTAAGKGRYMSHIRSEDISMHEAIDEIIELGREAKLPVLISHIKIALKDEWGTANRLIATLQKARAEGIDITADCYPYDFWNSTLRVLFPNKNFTNPAAALFAAEHLFDPEGSVLVRFAPDTSYKGKSIAQIARMRNETPAQTLLYLVATADQYAKDHPEATGIETIMGKSMTEEDIVPFLSWAHTNICSDGGNGGHPRGYGSFTRVLHRYVNEMKIMSWETAIHKMTGLAAEHTGIKERGFIIPGYYADLVLIDPETVKDHADISNSKALSDGIQKVWVNGMPVYEHKSFLGKFPGVFVGR